MSTDVLRRNVARELDRLHEHQRRGLIPVMCVFARVEGEPPAPSYRPRFSPLPYHADAPVETVLTDAVFHPSIGLTHPPIVNTQWSAGGTHVTAYSGFPQSANSFQVLSLFGQPPVHPIDLETPVSEAIAAAQTVSERLQALIRSLPEQLVERLGFKCVHRPSDWIEVLFHLGWHFPDHGIEAGRFRILSRSAEVPWDCRCHEQELQLGGVRVTPDVFPGVIMSRLAENSDFLTASISALRLLLEAVDGLALSARPQPSAEFGRLHGTFSQLAEAHAVLPGELSARVMRFGDSFRTPPATEWAGITREGDGWGVPHYRVLSQLNADRVVCELRGPDADTFLQLADRAGALLPVWPAQRYPALLADVGAFARYCEPDRFPWAVHAGDGWNRAMVTDHRGNVERWLGLVFGLLMDRGREHLNVLTRPNDATLLGGGGPVNAMLTLREMNLFAASARAIELAGLLPTPAVGLNSAVGTGAPLTTNTGATGQDKPIPVPRVRCDESDRSVHLDGKRVSGEVELSVFRFFRAIAGAYPNPISFKKIQESAAGLHGKHPTRDLRDRLPAELARLVESGKHGYQLKLPAPKLTTTVHTS